MSSLRTDFKGTFVHLDLSRQFSVRLASYLTKWIEMSDCLKTYEGLFDLMMRDQLLHICNKELTLYLKERTPPFLQQIATVLLDFSLSVKAAPHECVIRTGKTKT